MKNVYRIYIDGDMGELWLDHDLNPLAFVDVNDAVFNKEYHGFLISLVGLKLHCFSIQPTEEQVDLVCYSRQSPKDIFKIFKKEIEAFGLKKSKKKSKTEFPEVPI